MVFVQSRSAQIRKVLYKFKNSRCTNVISQVSINKSNNSNTINSDNFIVTSNLTNINLHNDTQCNTLNILQKVTDRQSSVSINYERSTQTNISEEVLSHQNSAKINDHARDKNRINSVNTEEEVDVIFTHDTK